MKIKPFFFCCILTGLTACHQNPSAGSKEGVIVQDRHWTESDRKMLVSELERTKAEMIAAVENLSDAQWQFKPSENAWNIAEVFEHIGLYERIVLQEAWLACELPPQPEFDVPSMKDSVYLSWMADPGAHSAPENAIPLGLMSGRDNLTFFVFGRDQILQYVANTTQDFKVHFTPRAGEPNNRRSVHGLMVVHFAHTDRHLRQIARIKAHEDFPKS